MAAPEAALLAAVGDGEFDDAVEEGIEPGVFGEKPEAADFVGGLLAGNEGGALDGETGELVDPLIAGGKGEDVVGEFFEGGGAAEVAGVAEIVLVALAAPDGDRSEILGDEGLG